MQMNHWWDQFRSRVGTEPVLVMSRISPEDTMSKKEIIHRDREALEKAQMTMALTEMKRSEQGEVLSVLDQLRRTRAARGGTGAPLQVPAHLQPGPSTTIIITDDDIK